MYDRTVADSPERCISGAVAALVPGVAVFSLSAAISLARPSAPRAILTATPSISSSTTGTGAGCVRLTGFRFEAGGATGSITVGTNIGFDCPWFAP